MKIEANMIGNYRPAYLHNNTQSTNNTGSVRPKPEAVPAQKTVQAEQAASITTEEKNYFANMYPASMREIADYHYYSRTGKMSGVSVGTLFDRRG